jgi:hypothetical protein
VPFVLPVVFADPVLAAAAVALTIAGILLCQMISSLLGTINVGPISIPIGKWFGDIAHSVESWAIGALDHLLQPIANWINGLAYDAYHTLSQVVSNITHVGDQIATLATVTIPDAVGATFAHVMGIVDSDIGTVNTKIDHAVSSLTDLIGSTAGATFSHLAGIIDSDIGAVHTYVDQHIAAATDTLNGAISSVEQTLTGDISTAIQSAEAAAAAAEAALSKDISGAIAAAGAAEAALQGLITGDITSVNATIAGIAATAATALSVATTVAGEFESCAVTTCDGPNNLSNLLNTLLGLAQDAALAAFIGEAIAAPGAAAAQFSPIGNNLYTQADQLLDTLLSI